MTEAQASVPVKHSNCSRWEHCVKCSEGNIGHVCFSLFFGKGFSTTELKPTACWKKSVPELYSQPGTTSPKKNTDTVYICRSECPWPLSAIWWPEENDVGWRMCSSLIDVEEVYHIVLLSRCQSLCRALERTRVTYWGCALSVKMFSHQWGIRYNQVWSATPMHGIEGAAKWGPSSCRETKQRSVRHALRFVFQRISFDRRKTGNKPLEQL